MNYINKFLFFVFLFTIGLIACEEDEDMSKYLDKWVAPNIQITSDVTIGAYYYPRFDSASWTTGSFNVPELGLYNSEEVSVIEQHAQWSKQAGIDVWLYSWGGTESISDTVLQQIFPQVSSINDIQLAIVFEQGAVKEGGGVDLSVEAELQKMIEEFVYLKSTFDQSNYFKVDGKPVVVIRSGNGYWPRPDLLIDSDPDLRPAKIVELRNEVKAQTGYDLYLIGDVVDWIPPDRYAEYVSSFDAITPYNMHTNSKQLNTRFNEAVDLSFEHWNEFAYTFVPNAIPSYNDTIQETRSNDVLPRSESFFREQCNISKKYLNPSLNLVFITSFNQWHEDTQVEPSPAYDNTFLDIINQEFKL
ncbi:MAG: hypothetical protein GY751_11365 [Bacteroidetes bacterium]|nr:hypothetical protein [Bacteroidota bacterium]